LWCPKELNLDIWDFTPVHIIHSAKTPFLNYPQRPLSKKPSLFISQNNLDKYLKQFAESKGFEPLHRINDDGLANHYNYRSVNSPFFEDEKRFELLT
jgi:hypothetical protein